MSVPDTLLPSPPNSLHLDRMPLPHLVKPVAQTPDESPDPFLPSSSASTRKRVEFSTWLHDQDIPSSDPPSDSSVLRTLPRSKDCHSMVRSILKPYSEANVLTFGLDGTANEQTAATMDSIVQQLANNDKISSVDAYQSLAQLIKTYDEIPEDSDTRSNVGNILRYLKRDLSTQEPNPSAPVEMNLATQALKVSVIFVWSEHLSPLLTDDFRIFITDRAINVLMEHTAPKVVIVHYMHLLATQNFRSIMFTSGTRTGKLLEALREITNHIQGKGALSERLLVYQKLIEQAKPVMKAKAGLWVKEVLLGLTSKVKDIQEKAISVCSRIVASFPMSSQISQATREALLTLVKDRTLNTILTQRLANMIAAKDEAVQVPQIWALVMLICNSTDARLENWTYTKDWLKVLQRCFNCSDVNVRIQAFPAWNRFIYITRPHEASENMLSMLAKPIVAQIERTSTHSSGKGTRPAAVSSYCTLLYYAFRPAANFKQYTRSWNEYVVKVATSQFLSRSTANADLCCRTLMALFWRDSSTNRIWNENRAHENRPVDPEELPTIDCKWVRSKTGPILDIFRLLFKYSAWGPSIQYSDQAFVAKAWRHLMKAIHDSTSKEIKQSNDTKKALSSVVEFLNENFTSSDSDNSDGDADENDNHDVNSHMRVACSIAIAELGLKSIVDATSATDSRINPVILGEVLRQAMRLSQAEFISNAARTKHHNGVDTNLSPSLQTCLRVFNGELEQSYSEGRSDAANFTSILEIGTRTLSTLPTGIHLQCIRLIEPSLSIVIKDEASICRALARNTSLRKAWLSFSDVLIEKLTGLPVEQYIEVDDLLASVLTSSNDFAPNQLLRLWEAKPWGSETASYGEKLHQAITAVQKHTEVNLPGIKNNNTIEEPHVQDETTTDEATQDRAPVLVQGALEQPETLAEVLASAVQNSRNGMNVQSHTKRPTSREGLPKPPLPRPSGEHSARRKLRHDNSQVQFVPITSLEGDAEEVESQYLTERQKEVRDQQRTEPAITFADLRSSPRRPVTRGSRASSASCEMARKVAALENAPATPTLPRQAENLNEEVLPSPTPKSRQQSLRIAEIDVPSSPPSVSGDPDVMSSPFKAANADADIVVSLEEMRPEIELTALSPLSTGRKGRTNLSKKFREQRRRGLRATDTGGNDFETDEATSNNGAAYEPHESGEQNDMSTNAANNKTQATGDPVIFRDHAIDSDELDEASASQLSQDLDRHLKVEVQAFTGSIQEDAKPRDVSKKRKRAASGYADGDRKRRRKRNLGKDSHSQSSSEPSEVQSEPDESSILNHSSDLEDCIVVRTTEQPVPSRDLSRSTPKAQRAQESFSASSTGRRKRGRPRKSKHSPDRATNVEARAVSVDDGLPTEDVTETPEANMEVHTPTPLRIREEQTLQSMRAPKGAAEKIVEQDGPKQSPAQPQPQTHTFDVMIALQEALSGLKNNKQANIDLRAIDDLCFQIRFQAQENVQKRA